MTAKITCEHCGEVRNYRVSCCKKEESRRMKNRVARTKSKDPIYRADITIDTKSTKEQANERRNARRRELRAAKKPFEECKHCGGNALAFYICCEARREERTLASTQKYNESRAGSTSKPKPKPHVCCDCGVKTPDRRCDKCRAKWNAKHGVSSSAHSLSADWQGF